MHNWAEDRKAFLAAAFILALLLLAMAGTQLVNLGRANPYIFDGEAAPPADAKPPTILILSPENKTYNVNNISLTFNVSVGESKTAASTMISRVYYKSDWLQDDTYVYKYYNTDPYYIRPEITEFYYSLNLTGIPEGAHNITLHAIERGKYTKGVYYYDFNISSFSSVFFTIDTISPSVSVLSVENKTYDTSNVPLNFTVSESVSHISYVLDGQGNVTIGGNMTLSGLSDGMHNLTVFVTDIAGNIGTSETIYFSIAEPESFLTTSVTALVASVAVVGLGLLVYLKKRNR